MSTCTPNHSLLLPIRLRLTIRPAPYSSSYHSHYARLHLRHISFRTDGSIYRRLIICTTTECSTCCRRRGHHPSIRQGPWGCRIPRQRYRQRKRELFRVGLACGGGGLPDERPGQRAREIALGFRVQVRWLQQIPLRDLVPFREKIIRSETY